MASAILLVLLPALAASVNKPERRPLFASLPSHRHEQPSWLLAATGRCANQQYTELNGGDSEYIAHVEFTLMPSITMEFTDAPFRQAFEIVASRDQVNELAAADWSYKNVALLEPDANGTDWAISTFEIEEHGISEDGDAVHYSGRVTTRSSNFPGVRNDTFPCQLFVDSNPGKCIAPNLMQSLEQRGVSARKSPIAGRLTARAIKRRRPGWVLA